MQHCCFRCATLLAPSLLAAKASYPPLQPYEQQRHQRRRWRGAHKHSHKLRRRQQAFRPRSPQCAVFPCSQQAGDVDRALEAYEKAATAQEKIGSTWHAAKHMESAAELAKRHKRWEKVVECYKVAAEFYLQSGKHTQGEDSCLTAQGAGFRPRTELQTRHISTPETLKACRGGQPNVRPCSKLVQPMPYRHMNAIATSHKPLTCAHQG